jgi:hypothetical protein
MQDLKKVVLGVAVFVVIMLFVRYGVPWPD